MHQPNISQGRFETFSPPVNTPNPQITHTHNHAQRMLRMLPSHLAERIALLPSGLVIRLSRVCLSRSPLTLPAARKATPRRVKQATIVPTARTHLLIASLSLGMMNEVLLCAQKSQAIHTAGTKLAITISKTTIFPI